MNRQIYRIDHYLGKETVQNILAFRFGNGIFEPLWNRRYVDHVQITAAESIGVEGRGGYYQEAGALRDMIQNHLSQVMATVAMEPPTVFDADQRARRTSQAPAGSAHDEAGRCAEICGRRTIWPGEGRRAGVAGLPAGAERRSRCADRYLRGRHVFHRQLALGGVPFYIRTGKRMPKRVTDIAIQFSAPPLGLFKQETKAGLREARPNLLVLAHSAGRRNFACAFFRRARAAACACGPVSMDFNYGSSFGERSPTAYETLLVDAMAGDPTLYTRQDMVDASWQIVQPILDVWAHTKVRFPELSGRDMGTEGVG